MKLRFLRKPVTRASFQHSSCVFLTCFAFLIATVVGFPLEFPMACAAVVNPGSLFAVAGTEIREFDPETGAELNAFLPPVVPQAGGGSGLALARDALYFSTITSNTIFVLNPSTGEVINSFPTPLGIDALAFGNSRFGPTLFALEYTPDQLRLLNPNTGALFASTPLSFNAIGGLDFDHATGRMFISGDVGMIWQIDPDTGAVLASFSTGQFQYGIGLIGNRLFTSRNEVIYERNPSTGAILRQFSVTSAPPFVAALAGSPPIPEPATLLQACAGLILLTRFGGGGRRGLRSTPRTF